VGRVSEVTTLGRLQLPYTCTILFQARVLLELLDDGGVKYVAAGSCYICWVCLFGAFVECSYVRFVVVSSLITYCGPAIKYCNCLKNNKMHKLEYNKIGRKTHFISGANSHTFRHQGSVGE